MSGSLAFEPFTGHPAEISLLAPPPLKNRVDDALPVVLQLREIEVQYVVELVIEIRVIRVD